MAYIVLKIGNIGYILLPQHFNWQHKWQQTSNMLPTSWARRTVLHPASAGVTPTEGRQDGRAPSFQDPDGDLDVYKVLPLAKPVNL